jgi:hypothetical protein
VPRLINTMMDAILGAVYCARLDHATAQIAESVAQQLGWRPLTNRPVETVTRGAPRPSPSPDKAQPEATSESALANLLEETRNAVMANDPAAPKPPQQAAAPPPRPASEPRVGESAYSAIPEMDPNDPGATGMLRLDEIDERFAETIFTDDPDFFSPAGDSAEEEESASDRG